MSGHLPHSHFGKGSACFSIIKDQSAVDWSANLPQSILSRSLPNVGGIEVKRSDPVTLTWPT